MKNLVWIISGASATFQNPSKYNYYFQELTKQSKIKIKKQVFPDLERRTGGDFPI